MNAKKRAFAMAMTLIMSHCCISASTAATEVTELDGVRTAFVSSFGKLAYNGKSHTAFKTFYEGFESLGKDGGKLVVQGSSTLDAFNDVQDRAPVEITGMGSVATGNNIKISAEMLSLGGDLTASNITLEMPKSGCIVTNGNNLKLWDRFDSFSKTTYVAGADDIVTHPAPISVTTGTFNDNNSVILQSGHYKDIILCGTGEKNSGNIDFCADGIFADSIVIGSDSASFSMDGNIIANIGSSDIGSFSLNSGTINGDVIITLGEANSIGKFSVSDSFKADGKTVIISTEEFSVTGFDKQITLQSGTAAPVLENGTFTGFSFFDTTGIKTLKIMLNGTEISSENGVFDIPDGKHIVAPLVTVKIALDPESSYVSGYSDGTFLPQNNMTRAEAITLLARLISDENVFRNIVSAEYSDVADGAWYSPYIGLFQKLDMLTKLENDGKILPDEKINRGEFCELISEIYTDICKKIGGVNKFSDVNSTHPFKDSIGLCGFAGIVTGYEDGTFRPENNITRAEAVTMINRLIGRVPAENNTVSFNDTDGHWARLQINAASNPAEKDGTIMWTQSNTNKFDEYMQYRAPLTNTVLKLKNEKKLNIGFIGGSITAGSGASNVNTTSWRGKTMEYFEKLYPDCEINSVNAAIGDSYTKYAVYRMDNDLLKYDFDLLFIEYAINDSPWYSAKQDSETVIYFETLLRRVYEHNPLVDIVIVYTIDDKIDRRPKYFPTAAAQEVIAAHYNVPSVNFGRALADHIAKNKYKWSDCFADYVHPNDDGHLYYTAVLSEYLENELGRPVTTDTPTNKVLPQKHTEQELWYDLTMLEANEIDLSLSKNWALSEDGSKIYPTAQDNELVIKTYGSDICIASPRDNLMYYSVDGGEELHMKMNRKPQTLFEGLSDGEHILRIRAEDITKLSIQRIMYNGKK
ncbi:MAG: S-layer homology domain-containing protein [Clostridia bacterium]|nr:S-layer homology domain-containing protein [Clostridia bacterium]